MENEESGHDFSSDSEADINYHFKVKTSKKESLAETKNDCGLQNNGKPKKKICNFCKNYFSAKNINLHKKYCKKNNDAPSVKFSCSKCNKEYHREEYLKAHLQVCSALPQVGCIEPNCDAKTINRQALIRHLKVKHGYKDREIYFDNFNEFLKWKCEEEEKSFSYFSQQTGKKHNKDIYYKCQHDGSSKAHRKTGESSRKSSKKFRRGQVKSGSLCTAEITISIDNDLSCIVKYFNRHSHPLNPEDLKYQPQTKATLDFIDQQIALQVSPTKIAKNIKNSLNIENREEPISNKAQLLTKNLIAQRAKKLQKALQYDNDDAKSVFCSVQALTKNDPNQVLVYKPFGQKTVVGPKEIDNLPNSNELFMLGIQSKDQRELMAKESSTIMVIDETHNTNQYKYNLLTCLVKDQNNTGWPVAHLITSKSDAVTLQYFFKSMKEKCHNIHVNCIITDDDDALINGFRMGFEEQTWHILCKWHLDKIWKKNIKKMCPKELQDDIYVLIKLLSDTNNVEEFEKLTNVFKNLYEKQAPKFYSYFESCYLHSRERIEKWATCFRQFFHGNVNTTGHVESFHNRLKTSVLKRKPNRRLDDLLRILFEMENDDFWERKKGHLLGFSKTRLYDERHRKGIQIPDSSIKEIKPEKEWTVSSSESQYCVKKIASNCSADMCFFKCSNMSCRDLCSHLYHCSCQDINQLCKHIHKIHSLVMREVPTSSYMSEMSSKSNSPLNVKESRFWERDEQEFERNVHELVDLFKSGTLSQHMSNMVSTSIKSLLDKCKALTQDINLPETNMVPTIQFTSNEKLKTQASQLKPFLRLKRKRQKTNAFGSDSPTKRQNLKKIFLQMTPDDNEDDTNSSKAGCSWMD